MINYFSRRYILFSQWNMEKKKKKSFRRKQNENLINLIPFIYIYVYLVKSQLSRVSNKWNVLTHERVSLNVLKKYFLYE